MKCTKAPEQLLNSEVIFLTPFPSSRIIFEPRPNGLLRLEDLLAEPQFCSCCSSAWTLGCDGRAEAVLHWKTPVQTRACVLGSVLGYQTARPGRVHVINFLQPPSGSFLGLGQIKLWQKTLQRGYHQCLPYVWHRPLTQYDTIPLFIPHIT